MITHLKTSDGKAKCGSTPYHRYSSLLLSDDKSQVTCKRCLGTVTRSTVTAPIEGNMVGKIFHTSYGYDMTINEYVKVIGQTEKSLLVKECYAIVRDDYGLGGGNAVAGGLKKDGKEFRIFRKVRTWTNPYTQETNTWESWVGSLHQCANSWSLWDGRPDYHNTWD